MPPSRRLRRSRLACMAGALPLFLPGLLPAAAPAGGACVLRADAEHRALAPESEPGTPRGYDRELLQAIAMRMGCTLQRIEMTPARAVEELRAGRLDVAGPMLRTPEREAFAAFGRPVGQARYWLYLRADVPVSRYPAGLAALADSPLRIAVLGSARFGDAYARLLAEPGVQRRLHFIPNREAMWRMAGAGRVDGLIADEFSAALAVRKGLVEAGVLKPVLALPSEPVHFAFSRASGASARIPAADDAVQAMLADGTLKALWERHFPCPMAPDFPRCAAPEAAPAEALRPPSR